MPFWVAHNVCVYHSHIPKTGGTTMARWATQAGFQVKGISGEQRPCSLQHRSLEVCSLENDFETYLPVNFIAVIRHPVDRLLSHWCWRHQQQPLHSDSSDFHLFCTQVLKNDRANPYQLDNHIRPQVDFVDDRFDLFAFGDWTALHEHLNQVTFDAGSPIVLPDFPTTRHNSGRAKFQPLQKTVDLILENRRADYELWNMVKDA